MQGTNTSSATEAGFEMRSKENLSTKDESWPRCHICGSIAANGDWFEDELICRDCQLATVSRALPADKWFPWTK